MKIKRKLRKVSIALLTLYLCLAAFTSTSYEQTSGRMGSSENLDVIVHAFAEGSKNFIGYNIEMSFVNATDPPLNTSLSAFNDYFSVARFSVVGGGRNFSIFLRVSYGAITDAAKAEAWADEVLNEFQKLFNLPLSVEKKTSLVNNATATVDVYYELNGIPRSIAPLEELIKYSPPEGFGRLVTRDLLSFYLQDDFIPGTIVNLAGFDHVEYNLTRTGESIVWQFGVEVAFQALYQNEAQIDVSLNELLRHSGNITPSSDGRSQVHFYIWKKEFTPQEAPLCMGFNSSSQPYTGIREGSDTISITYNLTEPIDNIVVKVNVGLAKGTVFDLVRSATIVFAVSLVFVVLFAFVRARWRKLQKTRGDEKSKNVPKDTLLTWLCRA